MIDKSNYKNAAISQAEMQYDYDLVSCSCLCILHIYTTSLHHLVWKSLQTKYILWKRTKENFIEVKREFLVLYSLIQRVFCIFFPFFLFLITYFNVVFSLSCISSISILLVFFAPHLLFCVVLLSRKKGDKNVVCCESSFAFQI